MRGDRRRLRLRGHLEERDTHRAIGSFGVAQAVVAGSALLRLPLIAAAIGSDGLGLVFIAGSIIPILLVLGAGLRSGTRLLCAERDGERGPGASAGVRRQSLRVAWSLALVVGIAGSVLSLSLPLESWFEASDIASETQLRLLFLETVLLTVVAYPGAAWWGALEAQGYVALGNLATTGVTVVGLGATVLAAFLGADVVVFGLLNVATSAGPFVVAAVLGRRYLGSGQRADRGREHAAPVRLAVTAYSLRAVGEVATRGVDPLIIGSVLGPADSAVYGVAQRMAQGVTAIPTAIAPILSTRAARHRGQGGTLTQEGLHGDVRRQFLLSAVLSVGFVLIGPVLAPLLGSGSSGPLTLYLALAVTSILWAIQIPIAAAASSPSGLRLGMPISVVSGLANIILSVVLVRLIGVTGPVWASALTVGAADLVWLVMIRRDNALLSRRHFE